MGRQWWWWCLVPVEAPQAPSPSPLPLSRERVSRGVIPSMEDVDSDESEGGGPAASSAPASDLVPEGFVVSVRTKSTNGQQGFSPP